MKIRNNPRPVEFIHQLGELFEEVQMQNILGDGKTFPDCIPNRPLAEINASYLLQKNSTAFDLKEFVAYNFTLPRTFSTGYKSDLNKPVQQHIDELWNVLMRKPEKENSSLIPLSHPYIVPGGRFREIYYWDSYFTMLGLKESGRVDLIKNMIDNFTSLIEKFGYIPNGNRSYFLGRSQPPFFSLMVKLLSEVEKNIKEDEADVLVKYLPAMEREYQFWMHGSDQLNSNLPSNNRTVRMKYGETLNRYWDANDTPRPESYKEDVELSHVSKQKPSELYRHLRAAAESGWDFSSRWFKDGESFETIHTTDIIPVDLNCLMFHLEKTLSEAYQLFGNQLKSSEYLSLANERKAAIKKYCWNDKQKFFFDYDFIEQKQKEIPTMASAFPLFFEIASADQALGVKEILQQKFLKHGGMTTTLNESRQQWDAPNGWAPLQWVAYKGLLNYGFDNLANELKTNWTNINIKVYKQTGKLTEKYNVWNKTGEGGGGEYPNQDGFGWTNGVLRAMLR